jgi:PRC-barrel domain
MAAFDPETLDRWRTLAIVDRDGSTVGTISEFYLDRETGYPTWALVTTGFFGATRTFVPLVHATEISDGLQVPYEKNHIKDAPTVDLHDELSPDEEAVLFSHYGVEYQPSTEAARDMVAEDEAAEDEVAQEVAAEGPGPVPATPPPPSDTEPGASGTEPGAGEAEPGVAGEAVPDEPGTDEAAGGYGSGAGASDSSAPEGRGGAVPGEPGTTDPDATVLADPERPSSEGWERDGGEQVTEHPGPADTRQAHAEQDERGPVAEHPGPAGSGDDRFRTLPGDPDLSRTAPVEPGLPGSTAASRYGFPATIDKGTDASGSPADEPLQPPGEPGWAPGAAGSFEEPGPTDRPSGSSDRWREAQLAAERDRVARAAAPPEERSPFERARRRLERLVGGGQEPADHEAVSPADREAAERARRARLGLDEDDNRH